MQETLLPLGASRWRIERPFEDGNKELGMDHFEVPRFVSIRRHRMLTCVSHLFLAEFRLDHGGNNSDLTVCQVRTVAKALAPFWFCGRRCSRFDPNSP